MKKVMMLLVVMTAAFIIMPSVHAAYVFDGVDNATQQAQIIREGAGTEENPYKLTLKANAFQDIVVEDGIHVIIDLAGYTLTNYTQDNSVIYIADANSTVTIMDTSEEGTGKIEGKSGFTKVIPIINNAGTLTIESGTIRSNNDFTGGRATGIYNANGANLIIDGGIIETASDNSWGITNLGTTVINGGTFNQNQKLAMIMNSADLTINNGTFKAKDDVEEQEAMITNDSGDENEGQAVTTKIAGGDFQTENVFYTDGDGAAEISGGTYENPDSIVKYLASGYEVKEGQIVKTAVEQPAASTEEPKEKNPDTSDINLALIITTIIIVAGGLTYTVKKVLV